MTIGEVNVRLLPDGTKTVPTASALVLATNAQGSHIKHLYAKRLLDSMLDFEFVGPQIHFEGVDVLRLAQGLALLRLQRPDQNVMKFGHVSPPNTTDDAVDRVSRHREVAVAEHIIHIQPSHG